MPLFLQKSPDPAEKLAILSRDSRYDLACSCGTGRDEHRRRSSDHTWIYPVTLPNRGTTFLFKTLLSNECVNNCAYCPLRWRSSIPRCTLAPEVLARAFLAYHRAGKVGGLFLSSAVSQNPDATMEQLNRAARLLRQQQFRGYIHLKIIPGASDAAIQESLSLASAVSLNIETPGAEHLRHLCTTKDYSRDILRPVELISRLTARGSRYERVKQTTQFIVGAARETDREIIGSVWRLYKELALSRVYFSAYQRGAGTPDVPGERSAASNRDLLTREHRLYQVDWLIRKYGFSAGEIPLDPSGNLSLELDPKEAWARQHPEFFPVDLNRDDRFRLMRVPGLGETLVARVLAFQRSHTRIRSLADLGRHGRYLSKAREYVTM